jgi:hypothetical protein
MGGIPPLWKREVRGDFETICLVNYGLLSKWGSYIALAKRKKDSFGHPRRSDRKSVV